eukprot:Blabericola_migrator_1__2596@NODE_1733_length_3904_cov_412_686734_g1120_i0_p2_GENE_NODE_1733_length_3904_cov_412_686734_g1120_i0NODE_1733_length_3904_cov_412_686734_g1120_i0_p2_ORF_typecomplete_len252_score18_41_NODE_1733_length_3904_cov_412_686734_g1120_i075830
MTHTPIKQHFIAPHMLQVSQILFGVGLIGRFASANLSFNRVRHIPHGDECSTVCINATTLYDLQQCRNLIWRGDTDCRVTGTYTVTGSTYVDIVCAIADSSNSYYTLSLSELDSVYNIINNETPTKVDISFTVPETLTQGCVMALGKLTTDSTTCYCDVPQHNTTVIDIETGLTGEVNFNNADILGQLYTVSNASSLEQCKLLQNAVVTVNELTVDYWYGVWSSDTAINMFCWSGIVAGLMAMTMHYEFWL